MCISDWSSDVCSSDLKAAAQAFGNLKDAWGSAAFNTIGRARYYEWISDIALELKGQGSLFGYPLVTLYADNLKNLTTNLTQASPRLQAIIGLNIDALGKIGRASCRERVCQYV